MPPKLAAKRGWAWDSHIFDGRFPPLNQPDIMAANPLAEDPNSGTSHLADCPFVAKLYLCIQWLLPSLVHKPRKAAENASVHPARYDPSGFTYAGATGDPFGGILVGIVKAGAAGVSMCR